MSIGDTPDPPQPVGGLQPGVTNSESTGTTQSITGPTPLQAPYIDQLFQEAAALFGQPAQLYPGSFYADPSAQTVAAANPNAALSAAAEPNQDLLRALKALYQQGRGQTSLYNANVPGALQFGLGGALSPDTNPYLQQYGSALAQNLGQDFERSVLPGIRSGAAGSGNAQSTRRGIAEGIAASDLTDTIQRAQTDLYNRAYGQGLNTFSNTLRQLPGLLNAGTQGAQTQAQAAGLSNQEQLRAGTLQQQQQQRAGAFLDQLAQQGIDENMLRHMFSQLEPTSRLAQFQNFITGPYGSATTQTNTGSGVGVSALPTTSYDYGTGGGASPSQNIFGGALSGLGTAPLLSSAFGLGAPVAGGLGMLGGILGSLF